MDVTSLRMSIWIPSLIFFNLQIHTYIWLLYSSLKLLFFSHLHWKILRQNQDSAFRKHELEHIQHIEKRESTLQLCQNLGELYSMQYWLYPSDDLCPISPVCLVCDNNIIKIIMMCTQTAPVSVWRCGLYLTVCLCKTHTQQMLKHHQSTRWSKAKLHWSQEQQEDSNLSWTPSLEAPACFSTEAVARVDPSSDAHMSALELPGTIWPTF